MANLPKARLTDKGVAALKAQSKRYDALDSLRVGLRVRVSTKGLKTWVFEKRIRGGKTRQHTLGYYPAIGVAEAREKALVLEQEALNGIDSVAETEQAVANVITVREALAAYSQLHLSQIKTGAERERQLRMVLTPTLDVSVTELRRSVWQKYLDQKAATAPIMANRIKAALSAFATFLVEREYTEENIANGLRRPVKKEESRDRVLSLEEIHAIYDAAPKLGPMWGPVVRLLILTAQRRSDVGNLEWSEIDTVKQRFEIPGARTKNGKPHIVHLSEAALAELPPSCEGIDLLFTTTGSTPASGYSKMKRQLDKLLPKDMEHWTFHDFRTAFATAMAERGADIAVVDRILNHSATGSTTSAVERVYNRAELLPQRARVLDQWADLVTKRESNVIQLHG